MWDEASIAHRLGHSRATLADVYSHVLHAYDEDAEVNPVAEILRARGEDPQQAEPVTTEAAPPDGLAAALAGADEATRARVEALLADAERARREAQEEEAAWDEATAEPVRIPK
jgi:hypothetical protein